MSTIKFVVKWYAALFIVATLYNSGNAIGEFAVGVYKGYQVGTATQVNTNVR
jgi:hypothetical protein